MALAIIAAVAGGLADDLGDSKGVVEDVANVVDEAVDAVGLGTDEAAASAFGCSWYGGLSIGGTPVPIYKGSYCAKIDGGGTWVNYVRGTFQNTIGSICNFSVTAEFFDTQGRWYRTDTSPTHWGCHWRGSATVHEYRHVQRGFMCSTLRSNGARVTSVCHSIH